MADAFKNRPLWADLQNDDSDLSKFILSVCKGNGYHQLSLKKLRTLGVLLCDGSPEEKATELYYNIQYEPEISSYDKDFKPSLFLLWDFATQMIFENEAIYMQKERQYTDEQISENKEKYDDMIEEFLDDVFDCDSIMEKDRWIKKTVEY